MQCGDTPTFVAGDVTGHQPVLHHAVVEGCIAGQNAAAYPDVVAHHRRPPLMVIFTDPNMAIVGRTPHTLETGSYVTGTVDYSRQGRARVLARNHGQLDLYVGRDQGRILGAEIFAPGGEHLAHWVTEQVHRGERVRDALHGTFYHPTLEEGLRSALKDAARKLDLEASCAPEDMAEGPGS